MKCPGGGVGVIDEGVSRVKYRLELRILSGNTNEFPNVPTA